MPKLSSQKRASAANKSIDRFVEKTNEARSIINKTENQKLRNNAIRSLYDYESANINIKHLFERARYLSDVCLRKEIKFPAIGVKSELYRRLRIEEKALNKFSDEYDEALVMLKVVSNRSSDTDKVIPALSQPFLFGPNQKSQHSPILLWIDASQ